MSTKEMQEVQYFEEWKKVLVKSVRIQKDITDHDQNSPFEPKALSTKVTSYGKSHKVQGKKAYCNKLVNCQILVINPKF